MEETREREREREKERDRKRNRKGLRDRKLYHKRGDTNICTYTYIPGTVLDNKLVTLDIVTFPYKRERERERERE